MRSARSTLQLDDEMRVVTSVSLPAMRSENQKAWYYFYMTLFQTNFFFHCIRSEGSLV